MRSDVKRFFPQLILGFCLIFFVTFASRFLFVIPYLDGNIDFVQSTDFYQGGFKNYFSNWHSVHPPLKLLLTNITYQLFGYGVFAYNFLGLIVGLLGLVGLYLLGKSISVKSSMLGVLLLVTSPLFLATAIFAYTDFIFSVILIYAFLFYKRGRLILTSLILVFAVMTKETALVLPFAILFAELINLIVKKEINIRRIVKSLAMAILPLVVYLFWGIFLRVNGKDGWSDWIFADTSSKGSFYTVFNNLITFNFLNKYAFQNWWQILFVNSNWIYFCVCILVFLVGIFVNFKRVKNKGISINFDKLLLAVFLFATLYGLLVLSFQTYTITRYGLPVVVSLYLISVIFLNSIRSKILYIFLSFSLMSINLISLFYSIDKIALVKWGTLKVMEESFYNLPANLAGNDGLTYNFSILKVILKRDQLIKKAVKQNTSVKGECNWIFPDSNNDFKTLKNLNLKLPQSNPCLNVLR